MEVEHAQDSTTTHLYPTNTGAVSHGLEVKRVWSGGGEKGKVYFGILALALLG